MKKIIISCVSIILLMTVLGVIYYKHDRVVNEKELTLKAYCVSNSENGFLESVSQLDDRFEDIEKINISVHKKMNIFSPDEYYAILKINGQTFTSITSNIDDSANGYTSLLGFYFRNEKPDENYDFYTEISTGFKLENITLFVNYENSGNRIEYVSVKSPSDDALLKALEFYEKNTK